ncbi:NmrA/HSCARG family protein [Ginsengibacter hankyongi]|uniref:NmrA/HSCARG family protein n=1 Tax=Ginsengibacter hankyongi TaxID=2607284 RepID=A0A5J5IDJ1_9BACT|nr:NmrA/HSCARG family protein [Ginsengibacter hankyongi]KAA9036340.1 NmrA/HSCARG family protein [Ginsengibacter hankyongi]
MSQKKIIVVFGATGAQGGGLAHAILNDSNSEFAVRAVTRDTNSEKAKALAAKGAEVVAADVDDMESMKRALQGAYGAYFVTFFWAHFSPEKELAEAKNMAAAAKDAGLKHVIWSTLEDVRKYVPLDDNSMPTLHGKYKVPHFDGKGESDQYFIDAGVPVTFMLASYYWDNLIYFGMGPKRGADGKLAITFPMGNKKMAGIAAGDIGKCAYGIFRKGAELIGKRVGIAGEQLTCAAMAEALSKALGEEVTYNEITPEQYRGFGFPGADDLGNMFQFYRDFDEVCNSIRDVKFSKELNPELQSFEMWLAENAKRIPID